MTSKKVLKWLHFYKDLLSEKQNKAVADDNISLADDLHKEIEEVYAFLNKQANKR